MLNDDSILLLRVVNPAWVQADEVTSQVFVPYDGNPISVFDGSMISPEEAFERFSENHDAYGVIGISVGEAKSLGVEVIEDRTPYPEHISLKFPELSRNAQKKLSRKLRDVAMSRGWLHKGLI